MTPLAIEMKKLEFRELLAVSDRASVLQNGTVKQQLERREIESEQELHHVDQSTSVPAWHGEYQRRE